MREIPIRCYSVQMPSCPFCQVDSDRVLATSFVATAFFDAYPITEGHTLVAPRRHVMGIYQLSADEQSALWTMVGEVRALLIERYAPDGFKQQDRLSNTRTFT